MIPLSVELKNFLTYGDVDGEPYRFDFREHRLYSISGDNGAGKSAIFDAITYTLYGHHRAGASRDEELLRKGCSEMFCRFTFSHNGISYRATRTLKKRTKRTGEPKVDRACQLDWYDTKAEAWREVDGTATVTGLENYIRQSLLGFDYETFISSVLLVQGESDRLIRARPQDRFRYLSGILDIRRYKRLADSASDRAKTNRDKYKVLKTTLQEMPLPTEQQVANAEAEAEKAEQLADEAKVQFDKAETRLSQVRKYHEVLKRHSEVLAEVKRLTTVQEQRKEINAAVREKVSIKENLPRIRQALAALSKAKLADDKAAELNEELAGVDTKASGQKVLTAEEKVQAVETATKTNAKALKENRKLSQSLSKELKLAQTFDQLKRDITASKKVIANLKKETSDLPVLRKALARLDSLNRAEPLIQAYAKARAELSELLDVLGADEPEALLKRTKTDRERATAELSDLRNQTSNQKKVIGRLEGQLKVAEDTLQERRRAGSEGTCSHCGQRVSEQHIKKEIASCRHQALELKASIAVATQEADAVELLLAKAQDREDSAVKAEQAAKSLVEKLTAARAQIANLEDEEALREIPSDWRKTLKLPVEQLSARIKELRPELKGRDRVRSRVDTLATKAADLRSQQSLLVKWERQRTEILGKISPERVKEVVALNEKLGKQDEQLEVEGDELEEELRKQQAHLEQLRNEHKKIVDKVGTLQKLLDEATLGAKGYRETAQAHTRTIERHYLPVTESKLSEIEERLTELADAEEKETLLKQAERRLDEQRGVAGELKDSLKLVPRADRVSVEEASKLAAEAQEEWDALSEKRDALREAAVTIRKERQDRLLLQERASEHARQQKIWDRLSKLLGRSGIQLALMKRDLVEIEKFANVMLAKISGGQLQLAIEFRPRANGEEIIFRCVDAASADEPLDVAFLSGGQKFRVAVALAIGIGQRAGLGGSMPSQIIDEGFGSLDEAGRKEMLDTIREISEYFERIIVVSHTDSFHDAALFPARYELRKEGRKTLVTATV